MEPMLGISPYSYFYHKLTKILCLSYYLFCFLFNNLEKRAEPVLPVSKGSYQGVGMGQGWAGGRDGPNNVNK
jgi:hypothetical protein